MSRLDGWVACLGITFPKEWRGKNEILHALLHKTTLEIMARISSRRTGSHNHLHRAGALLHLDTVVIRIAALGVHWRWLATAVNQNRVHPLGPLAWNWFADQNLHASGNLTSRTHSINLLQVALQMGGSSFLLGLPRLWTLRIKSWWVRLPQHGSSSSSSYSINGKQDSTTINTGGRWSVLSTEPFVPDRTRTHIGSGWTAHGQAILQQASVLRKLGIVDIRVHHKVMVVLISQSIIHESSRCDSRVITAFKGIRLAPRLGVSVVVFLKDPRVFKPVFDLFWRRFFHQLGT
mmetsp:Transcript_20532/g.34030  ORF Transcript_20532/g.34030 Transcript_20532/m.34030 type:complete len:291 (+) Transcript_20532:1188-2060(+)